MRVQLKVIHDGQTYFGEVELYAGRPEKAVSKALRRGASTVENIATRPSAAVEMLYHRSFFKEPRKLPDVFDELRKEGYNFSRPSILMALKAAGFLALTGRRGSYSFVQKFPPIG